MLDKDTISLMGYVKASKYRMIILHNLKNKMKTPTSLGQIADIHTTHASKILKQLKDKKLVECLNNEDTKGRFYTATPRGIEILKYLNEYD